MNQVEYMLEFQGKFAADLISTLTDFNERLKSPLHHMTRAACFSSMSNCRW